MAVRLPKYTTKEAADDSVWRFVARKKKERFYEKFVHPNHQLTERDTNILMRIEGGLVCYLILATFYFASQRATIFTISIL